MPELWDILDENRNPTGRLHERGKPMNAGDWHLVVHVWILNSDGEFLISKRSPHIELGGFWQTTGGSAVAGDSSLSTALKETREEIGIELLPENGELFMRYKLLHKEDGGGNFYDAWLFRQDVNISSVTLCSEETCDAKWADRLEVERLRNCGELIPDWGYPYLDELFEHCEL